MLKLIKPLVFFDLETTGLSVTRDRIVQIGMIKLNPDGSRETKETLVNPCMPISPEASEVHGITDEMVKNAPTFKQLSKSMQEWLMGCDLAGYNSDNFDIPMLAEEFARFDIEYPTEETRFIDVLKVERLVNSHKLEHTFKRYTGYELTDAHDAMADIEATEAVLTHQLAGTELFEKNTVGELEAFANDGRERVDFAGKLYRNEQGQICYNFGKSKDTPVKEDAGFGGWMLRNDFPSNTKEWIRKELEF